MNEVRPHRKTPATSRWRSCAIALLGLALVTTPVSYRAGTDVAHAHSFLHFLSDAASGSMDHHRHWNANRSAGPEQSHEIASLHRSAAPLGTPVIEPYRGALERATAIGLVLLTGICLLGGGLAPAKTQARKLIGIDARPLVPPPRPAPVDAC